MESGVQPQPIGLSPEDTDALQGLTDDAVRMVLDRDWDALLELEKGETRMAGKRLATYRKEGGRWRVATNCWNRDAPMGG